MTEATNPKILNLDELETAQSEFTIIHKGTKHYMRTLTVELFIAQQKRAAEHEKMVAAGNVTESEDDIVDLVKLIRDAVHEFFPTLPVDELETPKLFSIFAWLNETAAAVNENGAATIEDASGETEGNAVEVAAK